MTQPKTSRIPAPLYAAAGAGDLAYRQLRRLPTVVTDLGGKAAVTTSELRGKAVATLRNANTGARSLRRTDLEIDRLREVAIRNAAALLTRTHAAQERALATYADLVARGERVVGTGVVQAADTVNADMEATEAPAEVTAGPAPAPTPAATAAAATAPAATAPAATAPAATAPAGKPAKAAKATKRTRTTTEK
jgi:heparin binding hemagglutinin HbhA